MSKNFSDNFKSMRKQRGLTQEQIAETLGVSCQAVSKWETNSSYPDISLLPIIADYFGVSVDYLLKDEDVDTTKKADSSVEEKSKMIVGLIICIAGIVAMIIWGLLSIFSPDASNQLSDSSMIMIDGNGIFLIACVVAIVIGAGLLLKSKKR